MGSQKFILGDFDEKKPILGYFSVFFGHFRSFQLISGHFLQKPVFTHLKMSIFHGDITTLKEVECIVNSTNPRIYGLGGVCGAICRAAGPGLKSEIKAKYPRGCAKYEAKMTEAHNLTHLKTIIHTVGPAGAVRSQNSGNNAKNLAKEQLETCYKNVLDLANDSQIKSLGIPCIATGAQGFNKKQAALIAVKTVDKWLYENLEGCVEKVVFCCYSAFNFFLKISIFSGFWPKI